ncbi:uncharacterized protein G2W53_005459 [Senna tora]|uniref:Uncharacterized protein n=1 Tax=Senna tora TaxID=362788 RepID=A0A834X266_9FABA|nr:uncharacterized protein G2W53_005459 [Senna tora]
MEIFWLGFLAAKLSMVTFHFFVDETMVDPKPLNLEDD